MMMVGVSAHDDGRDGNASPANERRGESNHLAFAASFHLPAIASPAMNATLVGDDTAMACNDGHVGG
jgi:hypothetical protein